MYPVKNRGPQGGADEGTRAAVYRANDVPAPARDLIETMVSGADGRSVGRGALGNVVTRLSSQKNRCHRQLESHLCELIFAYELEFDPTVIAYYNQIPCCGITRTTASGRRHVTSANVDFLVFRDGGIELVECKTPRELRKLSRHGEWVYESGSWINLPYSAWAEQQGLSLRTWVSPEYPGIYHQNISAAYALRGLPEFPGEPRILERAMKQIRKGARPIAELIGMGFGFNCRHALLLLASQQAFGPWRSTAIEDFANFPLFFDREQAAHLDEIRLAAIGDFLAPLGELSDPVLIASQMDLSKGRRKLGSVELVMRGEKVPSKRLRALTKRVIKAREAGESDLAICITKYAACGNRLRRVTDGQIELIERLTVEWDCGRYERKVDVERVYLCCCRAAGLPETGISALRSALRGVNPAKHALSIGGMRGYQAVRPHTDPRDRSFKALGFGQLVHIDSTPVDMRVREWLVGYAKPEMLRAILYIAVDSATGLVVGFALIFGSPRSDGLAMLMRDIVRRNGFVPGMIHVDRGPENRSKWFIEFCETTSIRYSPTAGSVWNSPAEAVLRLVNAQVTSRLKGSTSPDAQGRKVDGRHKSRKTARLGFVTLHEEIERFLFELLPSKPGGNHATAFELREERLEALGQMGVPQVMDDAFRIRTSVPLHKVPTVSERGAIRLEEGTFGSIELVEELRTGRKVSEARLDCETAKVLYVRIGSRWVKAYRADCLKGLQEKLSEGIFDFCASSIERSVDREIKRTLGDIQAARIEEANQKGESAPHPVQAPPASSERTRAKEGRVREEDVAPLDDMED